MRVLLACEFSGIAREAFKARGHDAWSCDLEPAETPGQHHQGDIREVLADGWDLMIAFPPCTDLSVIGASHWSAKRADGRQQAAIELVRLLMLAPIPHIAVENPVGKISTSLRPPDQIIHPWQFGDPWMKRTCLWLKQLPPLRSTQVVTPAGHWVNGGSRTKAPGRTYADARFGSGSAIARTAERSRTFPGIAAAMAAQWDEFAYQPVLF